LAADRPVVSGLGDDEEGMVIEHGGDDGDEAMHGGDGGDKAKTTGEAGGGRGGETMAAKMVMEPNCR
jgi:hypothetical protein